MRTHDPISIPLPFEDWPVADRQAWDVAITPASLFGNGGTAAHWAAGPFSPDSDDAAFVPDFSGQTMAYAIRLARSESLVVSVLGATKGRVVSQVPAPGTVLDGDDRTVRLRFAPRREEG